MSWHIVLALPLATWMVALGCGVGDANPGAEIPSVAILQSALPGSDVAFSFASARAILAEDAGHAEVVVVLHTTYPAIQVSAQVTVADTGMGTATVGTDYATFSPQAVTFPPGSVDGDTQVVNLELLDDLLVEGTSETVKLSLQDPTNGRLKRPILHTLEVADANIARIGFATAMSSPLNESTGPHPIGLELQLDAGVRLGTPVSVRVLDLHTGSASSTSDYSFIDSTVSFPFGSRDGAVRTVSIQVTDDIAFEADETVVLGLSQPSAACELGQIVSHVLTIQSDDPNTNPGFLASEGPTGTENPLTYDQLVVLGSQTVGAGPNAGTLVRITNSGGSAMDLGAPSLVGSHPNDFVINIESSSMACNYSPGLSPSEPGWSLAFPGETTPMIAVPGDGGPGLVLRIDEPVLARIDALERVALHDFALPDLGPVTLEVERRPLPLTADAKLVIDGQEIAGGVRTLVGDLQIWRGVVAEIPGSRVFLALSGNGAQGFVDLPLLQDRVQFFSDGPGRVRLVGEPELAALGIQPPQDFCAGERFVPVQALLQQLGEAATPSTSALTVSDCTLALETDFQLFQVFGSSTLLTNYVSGLIGAVSDQYLTDVQTTLSIAYLGIHTTSNDGWSTQETAGADPGDLLDEFMDDWGTNWPATADLAHFLSGDSLGGGVAYVNVLCNHSFGFGVSSNLNGAINWTTWTGAPGDFTWDFLVVAHEIGHNFGSQHTHDYCPPLDHCASNCDSSTACSRGTIMSYCHSCGGLANVDLNFHPVTANIMRQRVNASCLDDATLLGGDFVQYRVRFNPLTATGARSATLELPHDATNVPQPFRVRFSGTAN